MYYLWSPIPSPNHRQNSCTHHYDQPPSKQPHHHHDQPSSNQLHPPPRPTTVKTATPTTMTNHHKKRRTHLDHHQRSKRMLEEKVEEDVEEKRGNGKLRSVTPISNLISQCHQRHSNVLFSEILIGPHNTNKILFSLPCLRLYDEATNLRLFKYKDSFEPHQIHALDPFTSAGKVVFFRSYWKPWKA